MAELTPADVRRFEQQLRERRETLRETLHTELAASQRQEYMELATQVQDVGDQSVTALLVGVEMAGRERELEETHDVEAALDRIARGTFGACISCRSQIDRERLDVYPTAKRCMLCQQRYEQELRGGRDGSPSL